ncbi:hypothetical protein [Mycobacterium sp. E787]|uniref:hypothetical protein n=1 Tax=Mycobacterium sp. E787 TaxID=1834150 RepID=UPI0008019B05|nr:hypothetical protein [Mycobacterium sp. E787]OBI52878.1 hypothetical protein A5705_04900 [Mycobacterium sp. E787]
MTSSDENDMARFAHSLGMRLAKLRDGTFWVSDGGRLVLGSESGRHQIGVSLAEVQHFLEGVRRNGK